MTGERQIIPTVAAWKLVGAGLLLQIVLIWDMGAFILTDALVERSLDLTDYPFTDPAVMGLNRLLVVTIWTISVGMVVSWSRNRDLLNWVFNWEYDRTVLVAGFAAVGLHVLDNLVMSTVGSEDFAPRIFGEYGVFVFTYGSPEGTALFVAQSLYYLLEALIVVFMIALFQAAGEQQFGVPPVPWGGIGLALTWGAFHFMMGATVEMLVLPLGMGVVYLLGRKHVIPVFLVVILTFFV